MKKFKYTFTAMVLVCAVMFVSIPAYAAHVSDHQIDDNQSDNIQSHVGIEDGNDGFELIYEKDENGTVLQMDPNLIIKDNQDCTVESVKIAKVPVESDEDDSEISRFCLEDELSVDEMYSLC